MEYVLIPEEIKITEIEENNCALSPILFKRINLKNKNVKPISELMTGKPTPGKEVGSLAYTRLKSGCQFLRTKSINEDSFILDINTVGSSEYIIPSYFNLNKGKNNERIVNTNDLLFVTGGNVGEVAISQFGGNIIFSSHILKMPISNFKYYVFAFLKNSFCKAQANFGPIGSIAALDSFSVDTLLDIKIPFPNQSDKNQVITFVELLVQAIINKENEINRKQNQLIYLIEKEIISNQIKSKFNYEYPTIREIEQTSTRLETGMYSIDFKQLDYYLSNYSGGTSNLEELNYKVSRGQNLQISSIGKSFYSSEEKKGFYRLALSHNFSENATIGKYVYLGNKNALKQIKKGDVIFSCRGVQFGRLLIFCENVGNTITNIDNLHIRNDKSFIEHKIFVGLFFNYLRFKGHLHRIAISGSGANSLTQYQINLVKFPNFEDTKIKEVSKLYYHDIKNDFTDVKSGNFRDYDNKWNMSAGIFQLDISIKQMKEKLNTIIDLIILDKKVDVDFKFLRLIA